MRLHDDLHASLGNICKELPHDGLPGRVEMDLRIFNENNTPYAGGERRDDNGKNLSHPKTYMDRAVEFLGIGGFKSEHHGIRFRNGRKLHVKSGEKLAHPDRELMPFLRSTFCVKTHPIQHRLIQSGVEYTHCMFPPRTNNGSALPVMEDIHIFGTDPLSSDVSEIFEPLCQILSSRNKRRRLQVLQLRRLLFGVTLGSFDEINGHGHLRAVSTENPMKLVFIALKADLYTVSPISSINHIRNSA